MVLLLASLAGQVTPTGVVVGSLVSQPLLVAAAGLVVVLAILLVFVMVLRSGDNKRSSIGIGYDSQQGPLGQPKAPPSQPGAYGPRSGAGMMASPMGGQMAGQGWPQGNGYGASVGPNGMGQGIGQGMGQGGGSYQNAWNDPAPAQQYQPSQAPNWSASPSAAQGGQWQDQGGNGGWGTPAGGPSAMAGNWGPSSAQAGGQSGWAPPQSQNPAGSWSQQAEQGPAWGPTAAPSQPNYGGGAPRGGGWTGGIAQAPEPAPSYSAQGYGDVARPAAARAGSSDRGAVLVVRQGKDAGQSYPIRKDRMTIGRSRESDIFLEDLAVSRIHTSIGRDERGRYIVRDENSANGTFVNNQRINSEQVLEDGDEIQIGTTVLAFSRR